MLESKRGKVQSLHHNTTIRIFSTMTPSSYCAKSRTTCTDNLVPIRIDCTCSDPKSNNNMNLRIVDTLLLDPLVFPIAINYNTVNSIDETINANAELLANTILADSEVIGMVSRTARHFTGRLDLWSWPFMKQIQEQIRVQLIAIVKGQYVNDQSITSLRSYMNKKKNIDSNKRRKLNLDNNNEKEDQSQKHDISSTNAVEQISTTRSVTTNTELIPIKINILFAGIRIHDEFNWDPLVPVNPLEMASTMVMDMNLPVDATQVIATEIAEQIQGRKAFLEIDDLNSKSNKSLTTTATPTTTVKDNEEDGRPPLEELQYTSAAWQLDQKIYLENVALLAAQNLNPT